MKKIITTLFLISVAVVGSSQSIRLIFEGQDVSNEIIDIYTSDIDIPFYGTDILVNNSSSAIDTIAVMRTIYTMDTADLINFAWAGLYYSYATHISAHSLSINSGDTIDFPHGGFHAYFGMSNATTTRLVHYTFYNVSHAIDSTGVTIRYNYSAVGINEVSKIANTLSNAYPNPANSLVSFNYSINAPSEKGRLVFYDVLGKAVKETVLDQKQDIVNINISDLTTGLYFYKFMVDDNLISTKKLMVNSK